MQQQRNFSCSRISKMPTSSSVIYNRLDQEKKILFCLSFTFTLNHRFKSSIFFPNSRIIVAVPPTSETMPSPITLFPSYLRELNHRFKVYSSALHYNYIFASFDCQIRANSRQIWYIMIENNSISPPELDPSHSSIHCLHKFGVHVKEPQLFILTWSPWRSEVDFLSWHCFFFFQCGLMPPPASLFGGLFGVPTPTKLTMVLLHSFKNLPLDA